MSGVVGVAANDVARFSFFAASITRMLSPPNTNIRWSFGSDRIRGRNNVVRESLESGSEWVLFIDDDHVFQPDLLMRLLSHEEMIVSSLYLQRQLPCRPIVYTDREPDGLTYVPLKLSDYPVGTGLVEVRAAGCGGMLIRSEVFRALDDPWFKDGEASEDLTFCERARIAGFKVHCDLQAQLGHCTTAIVWPTAPDDEWKVGVTLPGGELVLPLQEDEEPPARAPRKVMAVAGPRLGRVK
jgi:hypothetical protein